MKFHLLTKYQSRAICVWSDLLPNPAALQIVAHLESNNIFNNNTESNYNINKFVFDKFHYKPINTDYDTSTFKLLIFWRNPYYRLLSEYLHYNTAKTIDAMTFAEFIEQKPIDIFNAEIVQLNNFLQKYFRDYSSLNQQNYMIALLPNRIINEYKVFYEIDIVEALYKFIWRKKAYEKMRHLYLKQSKSNCTFNVLEVQQFFPLSIKKKIDNLISDEILLFDKFHVNFKL